jgi:hypothetical protein
MPPLRRTSGGGHGGPPVSRCWHPASIGSRLPAAQCMPIRAGAAPHPPRGGTVPVPQTPPQVTWSDCAGAVANASAAMSASGHKRNGGWQRKAMSGRDDTMTHDKWPFAGSHACAAPDGIRPGPFEPPLAPHAGVTGAQRPVRGGGAGPVRGSPANIAQA